MTVRSSKVPFLIDEDDAIILRRGDGGVQTTTTDQIGLVSVPAWVADTSTIDLNLIVTRAAASADYAIELLKSALPTGANPEVVAKFDNVTKTGGKLVIDPRTLFEGAAWIAVRTVVTPKPNAVQVPFINFDLRVGKARR